MVSLEREGGLKNCLRDKIPEIYHVCVCVCERERERESEREREREREKICQGINLLMYIKGKETIALI